MTQHERLAAFATYIRDNAPHWGYLACMSPGQAEDLRKRAADALASDELAPALGGSAADEE